jgi:hypothetical protein
MTGEAEQGDHVRLQRRSHGPADVLRSSQVIYHPTNVQTDFHLNIVQTVFEIANLVMEICHRFDNKVLSSCVSVRVTLELFVGLEATKSLQFFAQLHKLSGIF